MSQKNLQVHWQDVYENKRETELTWFENRPETSLDLIRQSTTTADSIIDVGGGASRLVDEILALGYNDISVLDMSKQALLQSQQRLGEKAKFIQWLVADVTTWKPPQKYALWHDRAVFHFLTLDKQRQEYIDVLSQSLAQNGTAIIATFALDGPEKCSGLDVERYSPETLSAVMGDDFLLVDSKYQQHRTPNGGEKIFQYSKFLKQK